MNGWILISIALVAILVLIGVVLTLVFWKKKKEGTMKEPNYQAFFAIGIVWLPVGVVFMLTVNTGLGIAFMGMSVVYLAIGLANRDKWKKK